MNSNIYWAAVLANDQCFDGIFFYAVRTTKIFCRPSCKSKPPLRENVVFFAHRAQALAQGYRPCKRCRPDLHEYRPDMELALQTKKIIDAHFSEQTLLNQKLSAMGISRQRMAEVFKRRFGITLKKYLNAVRLDSARTLLEQTNTDVLQVALASGFESLSAFYRLFQAHAGIPPALYRKQHLTGKELS